MSTSSPKMSPAGGGGGCPYARLVTPDDDGASLTSSTGTGTDNNSENHHGHGHSHDAEVREALALARSSCPAFREGDGSNGTCPFKNAGDAEGLKRTMMTVPPSHVGGGSGGEEERGNNGGKKKDVSAPFRLVLEHVHNVSKTIHGSPQQKGSAGDEGEPERFVLEGGCPFKMFYRPPQNGDGASEDVPFVQAMEVFSLSAIMAQMADSSLLEDDGEGEGESGDEGGGQEGGKDKKVEDAAPAWIPPSKGEKKPAPTEASSHPRVSLSSALKVGTTESHQAAENVHFVRNFIKGKIRLDLYRTLVSDLYHVYSALETELDRHAPSSVFSTLHRPTQLDRREALRADLAYFYGSDWESEPEVVTPSPATRDYVERIRSVAQSDPLLLLAHAYTRYLGDLSGGRVLARVARRALDLPKTDPNGLSFYDFPNITEGAKRFKDWYRSALDDLDLTPSEVTRLVAEANVAFALNMRLFEELDVKGDVEGACVRPLAEALKYHDRSEADGVIGEGEAKCPFAGMAAKASTSSYVRGGSSSRNAGQNAVAKASDGAMSRTKEEECGRCPWPFVFLHDPMAGLRDVQTWVVLFAIGCCAYRRSMMVASSDDVE